MLVSGVIRTSPKEAFQKRLLEIAEGLRGLVREYSPEIAAVEEVFYAVNVKTLLKLSHVRGVALLVAAEAGMELAEYSPLEIKTSVVGYGRAEKRQVQLMVQSLLRLPDIVESEDASDALAVAICHATRESTVRRYVHPV
jgi:crossover junction endodeoxyribonuclease RuvC